MARFSNRLRNVQVAAPCKVDWEEMLGDDRTRFCGQCSLNVYNLSSMTREDAEALIARTEGRLCVKFYRRFDGSIITKDCPIGIRAIKRRVSYAWRALVSVTLTFLAGYGVHQAFASISSLGSQRTMGIMVELHPPEGVVVGQLVDERGIRPEKVTRNDRKTKRRR